MTERHPKQIIEALLFASHQPLSADAIRQVLGNVPDAEIRQAIEALKSDYVAHERAFTVHEVAGGWQLGTDPRFADQLRKLNQFRQATRFSAPALETVAIIAYRQPITRAEIESIRGVNVDAVLESLMEKKMVRIRGRRESPGRPIVYGTTEGFLGRFGLKSLSDLPDYDSLRSRDTVPITEEDALQLAQSGTIELKKDEPHAQNTQDPARPN